MQRANTIDVLEQNLVREKDTLRENMDIWQQKSAQMESRVRELEESEMEKSNCILEKDQRISQLVDQVGELNNGLQTHVSSIEQMTQQIKGLEETLSNVKVRLFLSSLTKCWFLFYKDKIINLGYFLLG